MVLGPVGGPRAAAGENDIRAPGRARRRAPCGGRRARRPNQGGAPASRSYKAQVNAAVAPARNAGMGE